MSLKLLDLRVRDLIPRFHSVPEDYKKNPGAVEAIAEQPGHPDNILIGYNRGLMVLWNKATPGAQQVSHRIVVQSLFTRRSMYTRLYSVADVMARLQNNSDTLAYYIYGGTLNPLVYEVILDSEVRLIHCKFCFPCNNINRACKYFVKRI